MEAQLTRWLGREIAGTRARTFKHTFRPMRRILQRCRYGRGQVKPSVAVCVRAAERKERAGWRVQDVRLRYRCCRCAALETQLEAQLLNRREHRAQLGRSLLVATQLMGAIVARGGPAGVAQSHVPLLKVGSPGPTGVSCNGVAISPEAFGRVARRCCFSS